MKKNENHEEVKAAFKHQQRSDELKTIKKSMKHPKISSNMWSLMATPIIQTNINNCK